MLGKHCSGCKHARIAQFPPSWQDWMSAVSCMCISSNCTEPRPDRPDFAHAVLARTPFRPQPTRTLLGRGLLGPAHLQMHISCQTSANAISRPKQQPRSCRYEMLGQSLAGAGALTLPGAAGAAADPACLENLQETLLQLLLTIHPQLLAPNAPAHLALPLCQV